VVLEQSARTAFVPEHNSVFNGQESKKRPKSANFHKSFTFLDPADVTSPVSKNVFQTTRFEVSRTALDRSLKPSLQALNLDVNPTCYGHPYRKAFSQAPALEHRHASYPTERTEAPVIPCLKYRHSSEPVKHMDKQRTINGPRTRRSDSMMPSSQPSDSTGSIATQSTVDFKPRRSSLSR